MNIEQVEQSRAERKLVAREKLIYNLTEDLLVLLEDRGMSKAELAKALGKSRSYVTQLLSGSRNMTLGTLSDICYELNARPVINVIPESANVVPYEACASKIQCDTVTIAANDKKSASSN